MDRDKNDSRTSSRFSGPQARRAMGAIVKTGSLRDAANLPDALKRRFPIALEIDPSACLRMQGTFQDHVAAAVSKTVNVPADVPVEIVRGIFTAAARWDSRA
jgi:ribonucleotide reductase alpha subunit